VAAAVVTGAGSGLGRAIAVELAGRGFVVLATDIDPDAAAETAEAIGVGTTSMVLDVRDAEACRAAAAAAISRSGSLDLWVNNAGVLITGNAWEQDEVARQTMVEVNAVGTMNGTVAALERMTESGSGHVVNVVSLAGLVAAPGEVAYSASKHAAIAFTLGSLFDLRRAGFSEIEMSAVCPDGIWTPRPMLVLPRWRGPILRLFDLNPRLAIKLLPLVMKDARRRQRRYKKLIESGKWP
jgi:NAD(P)-dependent dehydrogenase (short-subunit alcohol dehydrogenase family)